VFTDWNIIIRSSEGRMRESVIDIAKQAQVMVFQQGDNKQVG